MLHCRLCVAPCNNNFTFLFENGFQTKLNELIAKYLCIEIKNNDTFSIRICSDCVQHLENFEKFHRLVEEKQNLINKNILASLIENETPDDNNCHVFSKHFPFEEPTVKEEHGQTTDPFSDIQTNLKIDEAETFPTESNVLECETACVKNEILSDDEVEMDDLLESSDYVVSNEADTKNNEQIYEEHSKNSLFCRICGKEEKAFEDLKTHLKTKHKSALSYIICCGIKFYSQKPYENHRNLPPCTFRCEICNKKLLSAKTLNLHKMTKHTDKQEYKYSCNVCEQRFMFLCNLREHIATHTNKKPFTCAFCGKSYARISYLRSHEKQHKTNQLRIKNVFGCELCSKEFSCEENYQLHLTLTTENDCLKKKAKILKREVVSWYQIENKCCACSKVFRKTKLLQKHLEVHAHKKNVRKKKV